MTLRTDYKFVCFEGSTVTPGRWVVKARLRDDRRIGYIEWQNNRYAYKQDEALIDARYLREILDFINELGKEKYNAEHGLKTKWTNFCNSLSRR